MQGKDEFAIRFRLALQALGLSRGRAASQLGVDKSLVGRWASGSVHPSEHNLSEITRLVARQVAGFTMLDWERDLPSFAQLFGVDLPTALLPEPDETIPSLPLGCLVHAQAETQRKAPAYSGFWRSTRPSAIMPGKLFFGYGIFRPAANGFLEVRVGSSGLAFDGWGFVSEGNLFAMLSDSVGCTPLFFIFKGVPLPKAMLLDGLLMLSGFDAARTPCAVPVIIERIGDLTGDADADDATFAELLQRDFAADGQVTDDVRRHLLRDVGPAAAEAGGDMFLMASGMLSRGASPSGDLQG
ncbi:MAG TPA: helix-turn-helix transcriptional regulator [Sphingomicrobium sp.]|nr:helix-turn-helix transcriptional regulator [Sphingomicrobium sp.]